MITAKDLYNVMCAMVPLYFAMLVAYASVKWLKIFSPNQCAGINRFVAVFAVPVLSFHFISHNNPYQMDTDFILADTLSKALVLLFLSLWAIFFSSSSPTTTTSASTGGGGGGGRLDWLITLFSLATLPNTLVMGIPLLQAMYGDFTQSLMVQLVVLQCIIWYTLLLFLFEYSAATILIQAQFPGPTAASITKFEIDEDVISLDGGGAPLRTESETDNNGRIRVRIRRSTSSAPEESTLGITPRLSNLSNADIFSVNTPVRLHEFHHAMATAATGADIMFGHGDVAFGYPSPSPRASGCASSDAYSLQPTPRASNFNEIETTTSSTPVWSRSPVSGGKVCRQSSPGVKMVWESPAEKCQEGERQGSMDVLAPGTHAQVRLYYCSMDVTSSCFFTSFIGKKRDRVSVVLRIQC